MKALVFAAAVPALISIYFGLRVMGIALRSLGKLGNSPHFVRMRLDEQLNAFFQAPAGDRRFRPFINRFFAFFSVAMALFGVGLPSVVRDVQPVSARPFFIFAAFSALMALGGAWTARNFVPGVGAFCKCSDCGRGMQIIGMPQLGGVMMDREEMWFGAGTAEQCRECARIYCDPCYSHRRHQCQCGRGRDKLYYEFGATHRGSMRLVKVRCE